MEKSSIFNSFSPEKGGSLYLKNINSIFINQSSFKNSSVPYNNTINIKEKKEDYHLSQGGAIYIDIDRALDDQ